jgi:hypothetical protein
MERNREFEPFLSGAPPDKCDNCKSQSLLLRTGQIYVCSAVLMLVLMGASAPISLAAADKETLPPRAEDLPAGTIFQVRMIPALPAIPQKNMIAPKIERAQKWNKQILKTFKQINSILLKFGEAGRAATLKTASTIETAVTGASGHKAPGVMVFFVRPAKFLLNIGRDFRSGTLAGIRGARDNVAIWSRASIGFFRSGFATAVLSMTQTDGQLAAWREQGLGLRVMTRDLATSAGTTDRKLVSNRPFRSTNGKLTNRERVSAGKLAATFVASSSPAASGSSDTFSAVYFRAGLSIISPLVIFSYESQIDPWRQPINVGLFQLAEIGGRWSDDIKMAWRGFAANFAHTEISPDVWREQIKAEILAELSAGTSIKNASSTLSGETGIVVMKSNGAALADLADIKKLQDSFSDRVIVNFDDGGKTGVIQPIFRDRLGEKYLFVITPINK